MMMRLFWLLLSLTAPLCAGSTLAQIVPDGTLGSEQSRVAPRALGGSSIEGGAIRGSNLFHSFSDFNVSNGARVYFANPTGIQNILTRVTGNTSSNINGTLGVDGTANLFLLNPNGIVFGQNARLDVRGSFLGSTANDIQFGNQGAFSATAPQFPSPLLTIQPSALLFSQLRGGEIVNQARSPSFDGLSVPIGKSFLLVGGNVRFDGGIAVAPGGKIQIAGLASLGSIDLNFQDQNIQLVEPQNGIRANVTLDNQAIISAGDNTGGDITISAKNVVISSNSRMLTGILPGSATDQVGNITINAEDTVRIDTGSAIRLIGAGLTKQSGSIYITTGSLVIADGASLSIVAPDRGNAGGININARNSVTLDNGAQILNTLSQGAIGKGGDVSLSTSILQLFNGAILGTITRGEGDSGSVAINARNQVVLRNAGIASQVGQSGVGHGGDIKISTNVLEVDDSPNLPPTQISAGGFGKGNAGNVVIEAQDRITIKGALLDANGRAVSRGVFTTIEKNAVGEGGDIRILTNSLDLVSSRLEATIFGTGKAGNIVIDVPGQSSFDQGSITSSSLLSGATGQGGDTRISVGSLKLAGESFISTATDGIGDAGRILIDARDTILLENAAISGQVRRNGVGQGKEIRISANTLKVMNGSQVSAGVFGRGDAGNLEISASEIVVQGNGQLNGQFTQAGIFSSTSGRGSAGNIRMTAHNRLLVNNGIISSAVEESAKGQGGNIQISADRIFMSDGTITSGVERGAEGQGGNIQISASTLEMTKQSQLVSATRGRGDAGDVNVDVSGRILIRDAGLRNQNIVASGIFSSVDEDAIGRGGNINISAGTFEMSNLSLILSSAFGNARAGKITIEARDDIMIAESALASGTAGREDAGGVFLRARDNLKLTSSTIASQTSGSATGGSIFLSSQTLDLNRSNVSVSSSRTGKAGSIEIQGRNLNLRDRTLVIAETSSADGGDINLNVNSLVLRQGSVISTTAGIAQASGNGGNIKINADVIVAPAKENSDISANAFRGRGGNITINTQGLFGIAPTTALTDFSDITASSQLGIQGQISISQPDVQPTQGITELPVDLLDASNQIAQICPRGRDLGRFVVSGRGSAPSNPLNYLPGTSILTPLMTMEDSVNRSAVQTTPQSSQLVEAQGWIRTANGEIALVARSSEVRLPMIADCPN